MSKLFGDSHRRLQREFDTERLADRIEARLFREQLSEDDRHFIERMVWACDVLPAGDPACTPEEN